MWFSYGMKEKKLKRHRILKRFIYFLTLFYKVTQKKCTMIIYNLYTATQKTTSLVSNPQKPQLVILKSHYYNLISHFCISKSKHNKHSHYVVDINNSLLPQFYTTKLLLITRKPEDDYHHDKCCWRWCWCCQSFAVCCLFVTLFHLHFFI